MVVVLGTPYAIPPRNSNSNSNGRARITFVQVSSVFIRENMSVGLLVGDI
jgi:hypothetical protein